MLTLKELRAQYVTNETGKKVAVILPIEELLEDIGDLATLAERREEPSQSHEDILAQLKRDGPLSN